MAYRINNHRTYEIDLVQPPNDVYRVTFTNPEGVSISRTVFAPNKRVAYRAASTAVHRQYNIPQQVELLGTVELAALRKVAA